MVMDHLDGKRRVWYSIGVVVVKERVRHEQFPFSLLDIGPKLQPRMYSIIPE